MKVYDKKIVQKCLILFPLHDSSINSNCILFITIAKKIHYKMHVKAYKISGGGEATVGIIQSLGATD